MLHTDYSRIADRYDDNPLRFDIPRDELIASLYKRLGGRMAVLDLACGTANYLQKQILYYKDYDIAWHGLDKSPEMLARARSKRLDADLREGDARTLFYPDAAFNYIKLRFAYHHFSDKPRAFAEAYRVLKPGGVLSIENLYRQAMPDWWVYRFFPSTGGIDRDRFLSVEELRALLEEAGFTVRVDLDVRRETYLLPSIIAEAKNRDISQLNLISQNEYEEGLRKMALAAQTDDKLEGDFASLSVTCEKNAV